MMKIHQIIGGGGLRLHAREWGRSDGPPILFIHGWSQNHLCWKNQYESSLADKFRLVAFDLRGHGMSEAPHEAENYTQARLWADDIASIIDQLGLLRPAMVGWSYAGSIICDYLRLYGPENVGGINFVGAAVTLNKSALGILIGPGFLDHIAGATADDLPTNIQAMRAFVRACLVKEIPADDMEAAVCWNVSVSNKVRAALVDREINSDDVLGKLAVPVLMTQGEEDTVILPAMGRHILALCPKAAASWYSGTGHAPFLEDPTRFNRELAHFVDNLT